MFCTSFLLWKAEDILKYPPSFLAHTMKVNGVQNNTTDIHCMAKSKNTDILFVVIHKRKKCIGTFTTSLNNDRMYIFE